MTTRFACSLAALAVGVLLVGGCGGSSSNSKNFNTDYKTVRQDLRGVGDEIVTVLRGASAPGETDLTLAKKLDPLATKAQSVLDRLRDLKPPSEVKSDFKALTSALAKAEKDLEAISSALKAHNVSAAKSTTQDLLTDSPAVTRYADAITKKLKIK